MVMPQLLLPWVGVDRLNKLLDPESLNILAFQGHVHVLIVRAVPNRQLEERRESVRGHAYVSRLEKTE